MSENSKGILAACITALLWGFLAVAMKVGLVFIDPVTMVWFRFTIAGLILLGYFLFVKPSAFAILKNFPLMLLGAGIFLGFNYLGYAQGLHHTTPSTAQVLIQLGPILLALCGVLLFKERINKLQIMGFGIAAIGLILFYYNQLKTFVSADNYNAGILWILFAAVSWTTYAIFQKKLVAKYHPQLLNLFIYLIPAVLFTPAIDTSALISLNWWQWLLLVCFGLNTLVAYGFLAVAFKKTQAYKVSIIVTLNPMITVVCMNIFYHIKVDWIQGEQLSLLSGIGAVLLLSGAIMAVFFSRNNKPQKAS